MRTLAEAVRDLAARSTREGDCLMVPHVGYGVIRHAGKQMSAHRAAYIVAHGDIPAGLVVRHRCDRVGCIEPKHLLVGTQSDNELDKIERGRARTGLRHPNATVPPEVIRQAVGEYLAGGQTQAALARKYGVAPVTIGRWVRGESRADAGIVGVSVGLGSRIATGIQPCGTRAGYDRHKRRGEPACDPCREACREYTRAYRAKNGRASRAQLALYREAS